jgi:hypothetical protein
MSKLNAPWRHHYLPEFFLRQWCGKDGKLQRFTRTPTGKIVTYRRFPSETGFDEDLYTVPGISDPWDATIIEHKFFSPVDSEAAVALEELLRSGTLLTNELRSAWAIFVSSLMLRTPTALAATASLTRDMIERDVTGIHQRYATLRKPSDPEHMVDWLNAGGDKLLKRMTVTTLPQQTLNEERNQHFVEMEWRVLAVPAVSHTMMVSDHPVIVRPVKLPQGHVALPISPTRLFVASNFPEVFDELGYLPAKQIVARVNANVVGAARAFVGAQDTTQRRFIENRFGLGPVNRPGFAGGCLV